MSQTLNFALLYIAKAKMYISSCRFIKTRFLIFLRYNRGIYLYFYIFGIKTRKLVFLLL